MPRVRKVRIGYIGPLSCVSVPSLGIHNAKRGEPVTVTAQVARRLIDSPSWRRYVKPRRKRGEEE